MAQNINSKRQRKFAADLKKNYFETEEEMLRILDDLDSECQGASPEDLVAIENLARDCGRLLHRWQRSSQIGVEAATQLLSDLDVIEAEKRNLAEVLSHREESLATAFETNQYMDDTGLTLQRILSESTDA